MVIIAGLLAVGILIALTIARSMLFIGRPNEILVISGKNSVLEDGTKVGYSKVIGGGLTYRIPVFQEVESMPLNTIPIDIQVKNAYSKGGIPLDVHAVANIKHVRFIQ